MRRALLALAALIFSLPALAQRQPAQLSTIPSVSPQGFYVLDKTGAWDQVGFGVGMQIFGVDPTGAQDATATINAALASSTNCWFLPKGTYKITDALIGAIGGCLRGDSSRNTILAVSSTTFNMSALGVVVFPSTPAQSFTLRDIGFEFTQPQVSSRASLVHFPPAIYAQGAARFVLKTVYMGAPDVCLDARGVGGGAIIDGVECGALTTGMEWDGALDVVKISNWHHWPFGNVLIGTSTPLHTVYADGTNNCITNGRIDDLQANNISCLNASIVITANATTGGLYQDFTNLVLDGTGSRLSVAGGRVRIANGYSTNVPTSAPGILMTGGTLELTNFWLLGGANTAPAINVTGGLLSASNGIFGCSGTTISCISVTSGSAEFSDVTFSPGGAFTPTPFISQGATGSLLIHGGRFNVAANGIGVQFSTDATYNQITNIALNGWGVQTPANPVFGQYGLYLSAPTASGALIANNLIQLRSYTVGGLPACTAALAGAQAFVTNGASVTYNTTATGGGSTPATVMCDGVSAWKYH